MSGHMKNQNNLRISLTFTLAVLFIASCMDPVLDKDEGYSDFEDFDAANYLNDPTNGFLNGGFEEGSVNLWGGVKNQFDESVLNVCELKIQEAEYVLDTILLRGPVEGDYFLRLKTETGGTGLYRYFSYNPGDTLEYSFSYMIPSGQYNSNDPAFNLGIGLTATDADANFMEYEEVYYTINNDDPNYRLYADSEWHDITISFSNSSLAAVGNYFQVFINEWSHFNPWVYDSARTMTAYYDDFKVQIKESKNSKPTDFSILHPISGDAFNLDTIVNFQTIPFSWEPSVDPDTVSYTNRLVCKVVCDGALISKGFESFSMNEVWDPVLEQQITRKMPQGYGLFASNWGSLQTINNLTHQYVNSAVVDSVSRTGMHSLKMQNVESNNAVFHHSTLIYRLSQVNNNLNKDRIRPGTELTISGYIMTPSSDKLSGENHAELIIYSYTDLWNISTSQVINENYSPDIWHPFEVSVVVPEHRGWPNTATVYAGFRYSQFEGGSGSAYFDDVTISTSDPMTFFVTDYYDVLTNNTSTIMSASYLKNLFSYIVDDLSGITFSQVDFEWGLIATDQNHEVKALNSPITFTVIDSTFNDIDNNMMQIGPDVQSMNFNSLNEILGAK